MIVNFFNKYFLYLLLAVATVYGYFWISQHKSKLRIGEWMSVLLAIVHTLIGVLCVKVFAFLESGEGGGMSLFGAIFFMPVFYFAAAKLTKRKVADVFDIFVICIVFTLLCARVNCLKFGCCVGKIIPGTDSLRWPTRELEIVFYIVVLIWLSRKVGKPKYAGKIYPMYMMTYGAFRFIEEWFRETTNPVGFFHISHIWALVSIGVGAGIYYLVSRVAKNNPTQRKGGKLPVRNKKEEKK